MQRLQGIDAGFLHIECPSQLSTIVFGVVLGRRPEGPFGLADLRAHVAERLPLLPTFRCRLRAVPGGLNHPVLVRDPGFDLDDHLRHVTVEHPGGDMELDALVARWAEHRLDLRMPLWRLVLVDGLADDRQAILFIVHHAICDGWAMHTTLARLFSDVGTEVDDTFDPTSDPDVPTRRQLVIEAMGDQRRRWRRLPALAKETRANAAAVKAREGASSITVPKHVKDTPPCTFNRAFTPGRGYTRLSLDLADLRRVRQRAAVTLNDVLLTAVSGAARAYLLERDDLPARSLTVNVPVSLEPPGAAPRQWGNRFAVLLSTLATDVDDPWERLQSISQVTAEARARLDIQGVDIGGRWLDYVPPLLAGPGARALAADRRKHPERAEYNVLVSNVKGNEPLSFRGVEVESMIPSGPTFDGAGLTVVGWSYGDRMQLGVLTNDVAVDAPEDFTRSVGLAVAELVGIADERTAAPATQLG